MAIMNSRRALPRGARGTATGGTPHGFGDNGINLELRLWVNDPENA